MIPQRNVQSQTIKDQSRTQLLYALNAASASLQKSAHSVDRVLNVVTEQIGKLGLRGGVSLLDETGTRLTVRAIVLPDRLMKSLKKLTSLTIVGYEFDVAKVDAYWTVVQTGSTLFTTDSSDIIAQMVPNAAKPIAMKIIKLLGNSVAIYTPICYEGQVRGVLNVVGEGLMEQDVPAMEAFANHLAIALERAQLFTAMQAEIEERRLSEVARQEMENTLQRRAEQLAVLHALSLDITSLQDFPTLLNRIVKRSTRLLATKGAGLFLCDAERSKVQLRAIHYPKAEMYLGVVLNYGEGAAGLIAQTGQPLVLDNYQTWSGRSKVFETHKPFQALLGVPLIWQGKTIGVLTVLDEVGRHFTQSDLELLTLFATQAAITFENARLFEAERAARAKAEALRDAARVIGSKLSLDEVLQAMLEQLSRVLLFDSGEILLIQDDELVIKAWRGYQDFVEPNLMDMNRLKVQADQTAGAVVLGCAPISISDVKNDPRWQATNINQHANSWLGVPLILREDCIGLFSLARVSVDGFSSQEISLVQTFALHASTAIQNAHLFEAEGKRAAELEAVRRASLSLTHSLELSDVLDAILRSVLGLLPSVTHSQIYLYDEEKGGQLKFGAAYWSDERQENLYVQPRSNGMTNTVARTGELLVISNVHTHPLFANIRPEWTGALIGIPLKIGQSVVGVMNVAYAEPRNFPEAELRLLRLLGDQAAIAIENANLFERAALERRHLQLVYDINRELTSSLDVDEILNKAVTLTCQALNGAIGQAFLNIPDEELLKLRALYGLPSISEDEFEIKGSISIGQGLAGWSAQKGVPVYVADVTEDERWLQVDGFDDGVHSAITSPITAGDQLLGVLSVLRLEANAFSDDQLDLLQVICREIGLALSNAHRYQQVQRQLNEITMIQGLVETINRRLDLQSLLDEVVTQLANRFGYPRVEVYLVDDDRLVQRAHFGRDPKLSEIPLDKGILGRVASTGLSALVPDVYQDEDYYKCVQETVSELVVPIFRGNVVIGVINIESDDYGQLSTQDRDLLEVLAGQISIALENAVLYARIRQHAEDLEQIVSQRTAELVELYALSQKIGHTLSYEELLRLLLSHLRTAVRSELVAGGLYYEGNRFQIVETNRLISPDAMSELREYWQDVLHDWVETPMNLEKGSIEIISSNSSRASDQPIREIGRLIHAPIVIEDREVGILIAGFEGEDGDKKEHERLVSTFSLQAGAAIQRMSAILAEERKRLESLVEHLPVGVLLLDAEHRLLLANPLGKAFLSVLNGGSVTGRLSRIGSQRISELISHHNELIPVEVTTSGFPRRIFEAQVRPVGNEHHQWAVTLREVTQERDYQARIQMQERLATVGQLAAGIAHDFNNIMAAILVYADLLRNEPDMPEMARTRLEIIQQQVNRASSLIRQILDFSRRSVMEQSPIDLLPFIKEMDKMLRRVLPETINLRLSYKPGQFVVKADPARLQQALMNLVLNGRDAMPEGGVLMFELSKIQIYPGDSMPVNDMQPGNWICLSVSDTGLGIPAENMPHIFEPFFTTKPVGQGTGLGLAQVYGIVKQHEGYIDVYSQEKVGTKFDIYLPAQQVIEDVQIDSQMTIDLNGNGKSALVVEDDQTTLTAIQSLLEAYNYRVSTAPNGREALNRFELEAEGFELVVSDLVMPKMGGVALYNQISERWPQTKILFITGHPLEGENQDLLETGQVSWLQKPFSIYQFSQAVRGLMEGSYPTVR